MKIIALFEYFKVVAYYPFLRLPVVVIHYVLNFGSKTIVVKIQKKIIKAGTW